MILLIYKSYNSTSKGYKQYVCTSRFRQCRRTPWLTARVQWIHVHFLRINGDVSFTILTHHQNNPHPHHRPREGVGHREVFYYCGGSRSTQREPLGFPAGTDNPKRFQRIDLQVKLGTTLTYQGPRSDTWHNKKHCTILITIIVINPFILHPQYQENIITVLFF